MSAVGEFSAEPPPLAAPPPPDIEGSSGRLGRYATGAFFLAPALIVLTLWIVYPAVYTIIRSFFGQQGYLGTWVGFDNYKRLFTTSTLVTAIKNNAIWVAVVPAFVTAMGLIFAVLTERVRWSVAFKTIVFLPMAISAFATGVTWRIMYQQDPNVGAVNALIRGVKDVFVPPGVLPSALIAPRPGSCWYMIRHVTPVANAEIAIGRKTIVLKATDQRTRSVSTAKISPIAVTNAGTTATQIRLFLIAVVSVGVVNSDL